MKLWVKILIGFALGAVVGLIVGPSIAVVKPLGDLFIRLIKMLIVPMVFCSLVVGASSIGDLRKLGRVGGKTIVYFLATTAIAITLAIIFAIIFNPAGGYILKEVGTYEAKAMPKVADVILNMVPTNPISAMATDNMLQIIVFALFVGISISLIGEKGKPALDFFDSVAETMYRIVGMVMGFAPIGVFALIAWVVGTAGAEVLLPLARVIFVVYFVNILHAVVVYSGAVRIFAGMSPVQFFKGFFEAMMVAFSTCSSSATLPISMRLAQENLGVPKEIASFVQPLGATINMDGTAIYQGVCAVFIANVFGITLGFPQYIMIIVAATLASIGTAGVPGAGMIMLSLVLETVGLPLEGILLVAGIDRILDMIRTSMNVTGDAAGAVVIAASEGELIRVTPGVGIGG
ncbi:MAG: dicarboxylate/amino acid:cation symporter [Firmicutes bacterium]|jgi:Na+/H+-dicarboxylate symporter|nr:dicarboxylate/amino acid:cation symporter [Bacillota bacterium]